MFDHSDIIHQELAVLDKFIPEAQTLLWEVAKAGVVARIDYPLMVERYQTAKAKIAHIKRMNVELRDEVQAHEHARNHPQTTDESSQPKKARPKSEGFVLP
jgi:hypothetical protein